MKDAVINEIIIIVNGNYLPPIIYYVIVILAMFSWSSDLHFGLSNAMHGIGHI